MFMGAPGENLPIEPIQATDRIRVFNQFAYNASELEEAHHNGKMWSIKFEDGVVQKREGWDRFTSWVGSWFTSSSTTENTYKDISNSIKQNYESRNPPLSERISKYEPNLLGFRIAQQFAAKAEMDIAKLKDIYLVNNPKYAGLLSDSKWVSLDPMEIEDLYGKMRRITSETLPTVRQEHKQIYQTAAEIGHKFREIVFGSKDPILSVSSQVIVQNASKTYALHSQLFRNLAIGLYPELKGTKLNQARVMLEKLVADDVRQGKNVDTLLLREAVKQARESFPEYFKDIKSDLSNLSADSYAFRLIADILVPSPPNENIRSNLNYKDVLKKAITPVIDKFQNGKIDKSEIKKMIMDNLTRKNNIVYAKEALSDYLDIALKSDNKERIVRSLEHAFTSNDISDFFQSEENRIVDETLLNRDAKEDLLVNLQRAELGRIYKANEGKAVKLREQLKNELAQDPNIIQPLALKKAIDLAKANFPSEFSGVRLDDLKKEDYPFKLISDIYGKNTDPEILLEQIKNNSERAGKVHLLDAAVAQRRNMLNESIDIFPLEDLANPTNALVGLERSRLNTLGIAKELNRSFESLYGKLGNPPSLDDYKNAFELIKVYLPGVYEKIGVTVDKKYQRFQNEQNAFILKVISTVLWNDQPPEGALTDRGFRLDGTQNFEQTFDYTFPEGQSFVGTYVLSPKFNTRDDFLQFQKLFDQIPFSKLEQLGLIFPRAGKDSPNVIRIGGNPQIIPTLTEITDPAQAQNNILALEEQLDLLSTHYISKMYQFERNIPPLNLTNEQTYQMLLLLHGGEYYLPGEVYDVLDGSQIRNLIPLPEIKRAAIIQAIKSRGGPEAQQEIAIKAALQNAQEIRNIYIINYVQSQRMNFKQNNSMKQFIIDMFDRGTYPIKSARGEILFPIRDARLPESFLKYGQILKNDFLDHLINLPEESIRELIDQNEINVGANAIPNDVRFSDIRDYFSMDKDEQNPSKAPEDKLLYERKKAFLEGLKIESNDAKLKAIMESKNLKRDEVEQLYYNQFMQFMLFASQGLMNIRNMAPFTSDTQRVENADPQKSNFETYIKSTDVTAAMSSSENTLVLNDGSFTNFTMTGQAFSNASTEDRPLLYTSNYKMDINVPKNTLKSVTDNDIRVTPAAIKIAINQSLPIKLTRKLVSQSELPSQPSNIQSEGLKKEKERIQLPVVES